jgi:acyl-CoA dehydrogenase
VPWDFETEPEFQAELDWMRDFMRNEIEPLETLNLEYDKMMKLIQPLQVEVKKRGLWAAHLPPELGGSQKSQVHLGLMHEILGRSVWGPVVFGNNAPDSGNAELLALGIEQSKNESHRQKWLIPLLEGEIHSGFSMTEPGAGADPTLIKTTAILDGDEWVINGHKWFTTNGSIADFLIVMAVTDPEASKYDKFSMIIVPKNTPGVEVVRDVATMAHPQESFGLFGNHAEILYKDVRVPAENLIGNRGQGFKLAQLRLGPGRIHHAMRWLGQSRRAFEILAERCVSRYLHGSPLSQKQMAQLWVADSLAEMTAARLMTLYAAWKIDKCGAEGARTEISMIKYYGAQVLHNVIDRAIQAHGAMGLSLDLPLESMYRMARAARIYDGPDEVHKITVARQVFKDYEERDVPSEHIPTRRQYALEHFARQLDELAVNL